VERAENVIDSSGNLGSLGSAGRGEERRGEERRGEERRGEERLSLSNFSITESMPISVLKRLGKVGQGAVN
jgi:hypothetical protein